MYISSTSKQSIIVCSENQAGVYRDEIVENSDAGKVRPKSFRNLSESKGTDIKHKDQAMRLLGMGIQMTQQDIMNSFRKRNEENGSETKSKLELHESFQVCILFFLCHNIS